MIDPLSARDVTFCYPGAPRPALEGVTLEVATGTFLALLGPNGSGKSTLLGLLGGLLRPTHGAIRIADIDPIAASRSLIARSVAYLPAKPHLPADYTALEVVLLGRHPFGRGLLLETTQDLAYAQAALSRTGSLEFADRPCIDLSSGERQRVLLARTLCQDVPIMLLDEPTSAQDAAHVLDLFALLADLAKDGRTVVVATHALNAAARHAFRLVVLHEGKTVADGSPVEVLTRDLLSNVFDVDALLQTDAEGVPYAVPRTRTRK